jgi:thioredoxin-related protein
MLTRRQLIKTMPLAAGAAASGLILPNAAQAGRIKGYQPKLAGDGMYIQPWFHNSFLILKEDLAEAAAAGKRLAIIWEQRGCPYCREMHLVNFGIEEIRDYIKKNFLILQFDLWGSRKVTDFDGKQLEERALARRWRIVYTPTINFFPPHPGQVAGKSGRDAEVMRIPGYLKPFHFLSMFEYVKSESYKKMVFQKFIQAKGAKLRAKGIDPFAIDRWGKK